MEEPLGRLGDGLTDAAGRGYPATVRVPPSRWPHVWRSTWDSRGSAAGSPSTSRTSRSTSPGSIRSPAWCGRPLDGARAGQPRSSGPAGRGRARPPGRSPGGPTAHRAGRPAWSARAGAALGELDQCGEELRPLLRRPRAAPDASSHWSTTRTVPARAGAAARAADGWLPGVTTWTRSPSRSSAAATPARTSEDLPHPEGPTTARTPASSSRRRQAAVTASRP